jgi:chromosome segregation protein
VLLDEIRRSRGASSEAQQARAANEERLRAVEAEITRQRLTATEAQTRVEGLGARRDELAARAREADEEIVRIRTRFTELDAETTLLAAEVDRLAAELPATEAALAAAEGRLATLADAGEPAEREVEVAKDLLVDALAEEARLRNLAEALRQRHHDLEGRRRKLEDEQRALGERLHANGVAVETARAKAAELAHERARVDAERHDRLAAREALEVEAAGQLRVVEQARDEATLLRSRLDSLRELHARYEGCTRGVGSLIERDREGAVLLAGVLRVPEELERAVAAALGSRLTHVVVPDTSAAVDGVEWLRANAAGSATLVPREAERRAAVIVPAGPRLVDRVEVDAPYWSLAEALLGHVLLADDLEQAIRLWRAALHPVTIVTRAGEAIDALGAITGGSEPPLEETVLARQRELRELETAHAAASARMLHEEATLAALRERAASAGRAAAAAEERRHALQVDIVAVEKDHERLDAERERIAAELEAAALEASGLAGEDGEVADEIHVLADRLASATAVVVERRTRLGERQLELSRWREDHAEAERQRTAVAVQVAATGERLRAARADAARRAAGRAETAERLASVEQRAAEAASGSEAAGRNALAAEAARSTAQERVVELSAERERLVALIAEAEAAVSADDLAERAARERLEAIRDERGRIDVTLAERRLAVEHLVAQLAERYGLGREALDGVTTEDDGRDDERAARVEALRARLLRLGDVNPAAIEELEELRGRHAFLVGQRTDLERSLDDLRRTIAKLIRTSRQRFDETFAAANGKLAELFPKLFPGGRARLELTEAEEGGDPGVEIVVQPSGKKLQSLSLLSGGEKAMTAVALILSLFLIRPTPFCLLDEVDAPLDEANIGRFNQLIREMAAGSQFVLITHNRRTMEAADTLYGITMEHAGVSKVVSVRLRAAA